MIVAWLALGACPVWASGINVVEDQADNELQTWEMVTLRVDAPHRVSLYGEVQSRTGLGFQEGEGVERVIIRPAVGYRLTPTASVWQGYAWIPGYRLGSVDENRIFQQLLFENKVKKMAIINRTRLEERFIEGAGATAVRFRHLLRFAHPIGKSKKWALVAHDEVFINLNPTPSGIQKGFDQNRLFAGINRTLSKHANVETGYMMNYIDRPGNVSSKVNHIIFLALNVVVR